MYKKDRIHEIEASLRQKMEEGAEHTTELDDRSWRKAKILFSVSIVLVISIVLLLPTQSTPTQSTGTPYQPPADIVPQLPRGATVRNFTEEEVRAPDFTEKDILTGNTFSLSQYNGTVVLLNFVSYGCNPALDRTVSAQLLAIKQVTQQRSDFQVISVFCGCCPEKTLRAFAEKNDLTWPWALDTDYSTTDKYSEYVSIYSYPTLVFIDKYQHIADISGYIDASTLSSKIDATLKR